MTPSESSCPVPTQPRPVRSSSRLPRKPSAADSFKASRAKRLLYLRGLSLKMRGPEGDRLRAGAIETRMIQRLVRGTL